MVVYDFLETLEVVFDLLLLALDMALVVGAHFFEHSLVVLELILDCLLLLQLVYHQAFNLLDCFLHGAYVVVGVLFAENALGTDVSALAVETVINQLFSMLYTELLCMLLLWGFGYLWASFRLLLHPA